MSQIALKFNKAKSTYDQFSQPQILAGENLIKQLTSISTQFNHVIDAGCGTGLTTRRLAQSIQYQSFYAIDIAESLLSEAQNYKDEIHYRLMNYDFIDQNSYYDLIFANMSLQWSASLLHTLKIFHRALASDGLLAFTVPLQGTFCEIAANYSTYELHSSEQIITILQASGYKLIKESYNTVVNEFPDTLTALRSIKLTGANHVTQKKQKSLRGKSFLQKHECKQLSYVIGYYIVQKQNG